MTLHHWMDITYYGPLQYGHCPTLLFVAINSIRWAIIDGDSLVLIDIAVGCGGGRPGNDQIPALYIKSCRARRNVPGRSAKRDQAVRGVT